MAARPLPESGTQRSARLGRSKKGESPQGTSAGQTLEPDGPGDSGRLTNGGE